MLDNQPFGGAGFLKTIRDLMNSHGGMLAARDQSLRYVFLDATFFHLQVLLRMPGETFTDAAIAASVPVVANAQTFPSYCWLPGDCSVKWQGEVISKHAVLSGDPPHAPRFRYFGQADGVSQGAYFIGRGDPSAATPPLAEAVGRLLPLVQGKIVSAGPSSTGTFWDHPAITGKTVFGIARDINAILVLVQQDGESGLVLGDLAQLVANAGIDEAVMGDGSDSATLVVNGTVEVTPGEYLKDRAIPDGVMFVRHMLALAEGATVTNSDATTDPKFQTSFSASGAQGTMALGSAGIEMQLSSLGSRDDSGADLAADLGLTLPATVNAPDAELPPSSPMTGDTLSLDAHMSASPNTGGTITGQLTVTTPGGNVVLDIQWPLMVS